MGRPRKQRRNPHGSAWHWKQTDCWYYTLPGTKKRMALFDESGERIRGRENRDAAEHALARARLSGEMQAAGPAADQEWIVARVCSEFLQYRERSVTAGSMSRGHRDGSVSFLNDLCSYCGALPVAALRKNHVQTWIEGHTGWRSLATHRSVIAVVLAAFNRAEEMFDVPNPLKGLKKPQAQPRLRYAIRQVRSGRQVAASPKRRDLLSAFARASGITIERLDRFHAQDGEWLESLVEDKTAGPAEIAAARIDVAAWLRSLSTRNRRIAKLLAKGETTTLVSKKFHLSAGRVSQLRDWLMASWNAFHDRTPRRDVG